MESLPQELHKKGLVCIPISHDDRHMDVLLTHLVEYKLRIPPQLL